MYVTWVLFLCKMIQKEISRNLPKKAPRLGMIRRNRINPPKSRSVQNRCQEYFLRIPEIAAVDKALVPQGTREKLTLAPRRAGAGSINGA